MTSAAPAALANTSWGAEYKRQHAADRRGGQDDRQAVDGVDVGERAIGHATRRAVDGFGQPGAQAVGDRLGAEAL